MPKLNLLRHPYRQLCAMALMLLCLMLGAGGQAQPSEGFDHASTAFPLAGSHEQVRCETCHIKGIFKSTPRDCAGCHVASNQRGAVAMSAKHIQISGACDTCHNVSSFAAVLFNHSAVAPGSCATCHDGTRTIGQSAKHMKTPGFTCDACHSTLTFVPVRSFPHSALNGDTTTCATCHNGVKAKGMASNHLPHSNPAQCGSCHINSTLNGFTSFAGGQMDHTGITSGCAECHGPSVTASTFAGVTNMVVMPPTSPAGPGAHIPSSTNCESCHLGSTPSGLMAANSASAGAPGTLFATPVPTTAQIHAGITGGCSACHETNAVWMGMSSYPMSPMTMTAGAQYTGFMTRPTAVASASSVADAAHPTTGDCSQCHAGVNSFTGSAKPANHIPTASGAQCFACHTTPGDYTTPPTLANTHANAPSTTGNCAQCHGAAAPSFAIAASNFSIVGLPSNHLPTTASCETCHVGSGSSIAATPVGNGAKFSGSLMSHVGITSNCAACHGSAITGSSFAGVSKIVVIPPITPAGPTSHIPSTENCESCHLASTPAGNLPASASKTAPGTAFATPLPTGAQIHAGVTSGCSSCHDTNMVWMGTSAYPIVPSVLTANGQYRGFQTRPKTGGSSNAVADAVHPGAGDCSQCHSSTSYFSGQDLPANHIPTATGAQCTACHTTAPDYATVPTLTNIHAFAPSTTGNCAQCHSAAAAAFFAIPAAGFSVVGTPANHLPTSGACETCHVGAGSSMAALPVTNGAKFSGSLMSHTGISSNCAACHGSGITASSFVGVSKIVVMPPTSPAGASSHIPSSAPCESCHLATTPTGPMPASASANVPGSAFASPAPTTAQIHSGVTSGCSSCHESLTGWMGMNVYPITPTVKVALAQYTGFHIRPKAAGGTLNVADATHPPAGDCSQCHANTNYFSGQDMPANHIPIASAALCSACHTTPGDFATPPTLANIHANAPSTTANCAQCHGAAAPSFAIPAAGFAIVGLPGNHLPTSAGCETCHVGAGSSIAATPVGNGAKFSGSLMSHAGISSNCVACHGPSITGSSFAGVSSIVVMPATAPMGSGAHIPSSTTCESCHLATTPSGLVPASASKNAPGSLFATPAPTTAQIHAGVTGGCSSCHDTNFVWMGVSAYPIAPTTKSTGAQYTGFQTRPKTAAGTYSVADATHPTSGDCSQCHAGTNYFSGTDMPANHIPTASSSLCSACHLTPGDYATQPTMANIHANAPSTSGNCAQCHGAAAASFAIPAANFAIVGAPANHMPVSTACETCHVGAGSSIAATPVGNGAKFSGSRMNHAGITNNCAACHGPSITGASFIGVSSIVVMPPTSPMGASAHIPSSTICEACHMGSTPVGLMAASATKAAPGSAFATPAPTGVQIHAGVTSGCSACHDSGAVWMGVSVYPIAPTTKLAGAQYNGFQTRPKAAGGTFNVADATHPATGDCSQCHAGTSFFSGTDKPANHIPYSAAALCSACHTTPGDYAALPTLANIHANAPSTTGNCAQCHGAASASFAIPGANFAIVGLPANHLPTSGACETCHVGAGSSIATLPVGNGAKFSGSLMSHAGITTNCVSCHVPSGSASAFAGVASIVGMPSTSPVGASSHIPSSTVCESCHLGSTPTALVAASSSKTAPGTLFATPAPSTAQIHAGVTGGCSSCHDTSFVWMGMSAYPIAPSSKIAGSQYTGFQTRPKTAAGTYNVADATHPTTGDCSQCHAGTNYFSGTDKPANHIPYSAAALCSACHTTPGDYATVPTMVNIHLYAPSTTGNCAQCHGVAAASFAIPAAGFSIVGLPSNHLPTSASCETCHIGAGSSIAALPVGNGAKFSGSLMNHAGISSNCVSCHVASGSSSSFAGVASIVTMPPTAPAGSASHIPSSTTCETCHLGSTPVGLTPASASKLAPGTAFAVPAPTTTQIHNGITGGCSSCHDSNMVWMGVSAYPISPTVMTLAAQYTGFHTRPLATAGTYTVADAAHPVAGDCGQCHSNLNYFLSPDKPTNHIPTAASAQCNACHLTNDYAVLPSLANIHANAPSTTGNCTQCHGAAAPTFAIPAANFSIVGLPGNHLPTSASCEVCHVGPGSSVAALPVANGAKFSGSLMNHAGIATNCVACHVTAGTTVSFAGVSSIVGMPATSPPGATSHIPSSTVCENCHLATLPSGLVAASATKTAPGTSFASPAPTGAQIHNGVTSGCSACHDTSYVWMGVGAYPITPSTLTPGAQYKGFQTRPKTAATTYSVADPAHPTTGDCSQCHAGTTSFTGVDKPANHIPYAAAATCNACHTATDYAVLPTLATIHANAPSTSANCAQCHGTAAPTFAIPAANFAIVGLPANHLPTTASCEVCHVGAGSSVATTPVVNGARFSGSLMSHAGITSNCEACHGAAITGSSFIGVTRIVVLPPTSPVGATSHIPSNSTCENCHLGTTPTGLVPAASSKTAPGTLFATPAPTTAQIHTGVTSGCSSCHDSSMVWMGVAAYPIAPTTLTTGAQYTGFQTRPKTAAGTYSVADAAHPTSGDCSQCHSGTNFFTGVDKPANHIPYAAAATCNACHTGTDYSVLPTLTAIHANAPSTSVNCAQCHGAAAPSFAIPAANFSIVGLPGNHIPTTATCESCHVGAGSSIAAVPVVNGAKFSGSLMSHAGITNNCEACHGANISGTSFAGVTKIVVMPPTTPAGAAAHIPSTQSCDTCHLGTTPAGMVPASATKSAPGTLFATPAPTGIQIHTGVTGNCSACHETSMVWMGVSAYPITPAVLSAAGTQYKGFQTRPKTAASTYAIADPAHPSAGGDCSVCHAGTTFFVGEVKPANHIPYAATAQCNSCHTSTDYSVLPTLTNIHAYAPSTSTNCAQCHGAAAPTFAIPAANFSIVGLPSNHIPTTAACESCHVGTGSSIAATPVVNGAKFSGSLMSHAGITNNCEACHAASITGSSFVGISKIVVMPPTTPVGAAAHIPSTTSCDTCHLGTTPAGMVPAVATKSAPGTLFATPAPTGLQIHTGITANCNACHDTSMVWMGVSAYPIAPGVITTGAQYKGFQTRPKTAASTYAVADAAHPATGDCSACHTGTTFFSGDLKPANHIPYAAAAACSACHTSTDYSVMPTLTAIHANAASTTNNCAQCHGAAASTFAIPAANFAIVGLPTNHLPTTASCEVCHVGTGSSIAALPVVNGAKFTSSKMSHTGITTNCVSCHVPSGTTASFIGVTSIVGMPPTSPAGAAAHIPSSTTCENCHLGTTPTGLVAASATKTAPGTAFLTPAPTTAQIHAGITSGCNACHDTNLVWMSMSAYPMSPSVITAGTNVQYTGFNSRPTSAGSTYAIKDAAHPTTGDCSVCHTGTDYFSGLAKPTGHIPTTGACATCHIVAGDYSIAGLATNANLHSALAAIPATCISCHTAATGAGPFAGCTTQATCAVPPALTYQPKAMPLLAGGSPTAPSPSTHVPAAGIACDKCHSPTVFTSFAGMNMQGNTLAHQSEGTATCITCHEGTPVYSWYGATATSTPKLVTRAVGHEGRKAGQDCIACHSKVYTKFSGAAARVRPVLRGAMNSISQRVLPDGTFAATSAFSHVGVTPAQCQTCHNGQTATGQPAKHLPTRLSCDSCHRTTAWKPAQFSHDGVVAGQCQSCHNSVAATGKVAGHFQTSRSCDSCHRNVAWLPVSYAHVSPLYQAQPDKMTCVACHVSNGEIIPRQMRGNTRPRPIPGRTAP